MRCRKKETIAFTSHDCHRLIPSHNINPLITIPSKVMTVSRAISAHRRIRKQILLSSDDYIVRGDNLAHSNSRNLIDHVLW
jgi:hypothetical protein